MKSGMLAAESAFDLVTNFGDEAKTRGNDRTPFSV